jgi:hypothetical protein
MEKASSSEISVTIYQCIRRQNPEDVISIGVRTQNILMLCLLDEAVVIVMNV